jgi:hypothetical protein
MTKIYVSISGGCLAEILSTDPTIEVEVWDWDSLEEENWDTTELEEEWRKLCMILTDIS